MEDDVECQDCGWSVPAGALSCSDEVSLRNKPISETVFNRCPDCGSQEIEDFE